MSSIKPYKTANRRAWTHFNNYIEEYWDSCWVEAHKLPTEDIE